MSPDFTHRLRELMQSVGFSSFRALSQAAGVSENQILRLRRGDTQLRVETLLKLSHVLQVPVSELLPVAADAKGQRSAVSSHRSAVSSQNSKLKTQNSKLEIDHAALHQRLLDLQHEYDRLQQQLAQQRQDLWQEFQQSSVQVLESLLLQLPTAAYAAQQNPQAPAVKLLPLLRPLDQLLQAWGIEPIATVGAEVPYDPQQHQLMAGVAQPGDRVKVRYTGYRQGDRLLYRAKVSPVV
jgi:molecular chaperone GrpE (heat shock protein)